MNPNSTVSGHPWLVNRPYDPHHRNSSVTNLVWMAQPHMGGGWLPICRILTMELKAVAILMWERFGYYVHTISKSSVVES